MAYYDRIAKQWHKATGYKGGAFKEYVLNGLLLDKVPGVNEFAILELGTGNGYFMPLLLRRFSGQQFSRMVLTDQSKKMLEIAEGRFRVPGANYQLLNVGLRFPFENGDFDLVLASFVFNEVGNRRLRNGINECYRVLASDGLFLMTVTHPDFVDSLSRRGQLRRTARGGLTMPGSGNLRLPVVPRATKTYRDILVATGFQFEEEDVFPSDEVLNKKPGLRQVGSVPLALVFTCRK